MAVTKILNKFCKYTEEFMGPARVTLMLQALGELIVTTWTDGLSTGMFTQGHRESSKPD